jgi:hypothetical protein
MHRTTPDFRKRFQALSEQVRRFAEKNFALLKENPKHPSLQFKKVGKFWSARVGLDHRALAVEDDQGFIWVWIGRHDHYVKLLNK